ncbi:unnamed protein product [Rotaria sp. Silwood1]|nr:unnamed protein product [Rotaria sp. Silwood1]CAF1618992.1 unnamed protein product [Rotaria sp. Silwood1]CAF3742068.1 unnamed protein product [Rotaria sp. Silwood1]CAF3811572.1 unnamed protein product [Rotaria sp. Silwood1]CAF3847806.1 unnamed protein product [Rotaria sp. Silwood1]
MLYLWSNDESLAFKNGGGAFLIPYFCIYFLVGTPLYFLELSLGQFTSRSTTAAFTMSRMFKGVGWATAINAFFVSLYYNVIIAWCLFYLFASMRRTLPWSYCGNWWNTGRCLNADGSSNSTENFLCLATNQSNNCSSPVFSPEEYFNNYVLRRSDSLEEIGSPIWSLTLCLLLAWIAVALCLVKGIKSTGKVVYFTALFPYVVIIALIVRGATLPGAKDGIIFYLKPNWSKVSEFNVWIAAAVQVFFSLGVAFGPILSYASFNKFKSNYLKDCIVVTVCDCFTSVFAGFAVFSVLGFMSFKTGLPVEKVAQIGPGLAFIAYPQALSMMPISVFWAILFFIMLLTLGLDSQFALCDVLISGLLDTFTKLRRYKIFVVIGYCIVGFLLALPMCTPGGIYLFVCFNNFMEDIRMMLNRRPLEPYWFITWCISGPIIILIVFFASLIQFQPPKEGNYVYPPYANAIGWLFVCASLIFIPIIMIHELIKAWKATKNYQNQISIYMPHYLRMLTYASQPQDDWGPARKENQCDRYEALNKKTTVPIHIDNAIDSQID